MLGGIDINHDYRVRIPFTVGFMSDGEINMWNETCARAIEMFGLPGDKYTCRFTKEAIEFWFLEEKDAMIFELTCG
jgi:hypothetical protein